MGWQNFHQHDAAIWASLISQDLRCNCRRAQLALTTTGIPLLFHYLNDFIIVGTPQSVQCVDSLEILDKECSWLSVSVTAHKCESPTTCLPVLGIVIDTIAGELHLPEDKLERLQSLLQQWDDRAACTHKELESLIGLHNHACKVQSNLDDPNPFWPAPKSKRSDKQKVRIIESLYSMYS